MTTPDVVTQYRTVIGLMQAYATTQQTQNICIIFAQVEHCTNVIQMFCVYWALPFMAVTGRQSRSLVLR